MTIRVALPKIDARDEAWVARVRAGDYAAFTAMFEAYYGSLVEFARLLTGSPDIADDVVQDVFVRVWERRADWQVTSGLSSYLSGAVRNGAFRDARSREVRERLARWVEPVGAANDPGAAAEGAEVDAAIAKAIAGLPERTRAVYLMRWYDQLTYVEIAHIMGVSQKAVEARVSAALKRLRVVLRRLV